MPTANLTPPTAPSYRWCHHDGRLCDVSDATLSALSLTARYGLGVFEGVRLYRQHRPHSQQGQAPADGHRSAPVLPLALGPHLRRLVHSTRDLHLPTSTLRPLRQAIAAVLAANDPQQDAYLRIAINASNSGPLASAARGCLTVSLSPLGRGGFTPGGRRLKVLISDWQRAGPAVLPSHIKAVCSYAAARAALMAARTAGHDSCILRAADLSLCEAPTAALFVVRDGQVLTPPLSSGCLPSITRRTVIALCHRLGLVCRRRRLWPDDLRQADEAFLAGTAIELAPIGAADGAALPAQQPVLAALAQAYFAMARGQAPALRGLGPAPLPG